MIIIKKTDSVSQFQILVKFVWVDTRRIEINLRIDLKLRVVSFYPVFIIILLYTKKYCDIYILSILARNYWLPLTCNAKLF